MDGGQALTVAKDPFEEERVLEYECYDSTWQPQGRGVITLKECEDAAVGLFTGTHGPSSDGCYAWHPEHQISLENGIQQGADPRLVAPGQRRARPSGWEALWAL